MLVTFRKHLHLSRLLVLATMSLYLSACVSWHTQPLAPAGHSTLENNKTYRVTLADGDRLMIGHPQVVGDSVIWTETPFGPPVRKALALVDIQKAEVQGTSDVGTFAVVVGAIGFIALLVSTIKINYLPGCHQPCSL